MSLRLYNTRTRGVQEFKPLNPPNVRIYVCGLTPSAAAHIGHFRTYLCFDVLRRYLDHLGLHVQYVQNVTDIDDRSIARAQQTGENWHDIVLGFYRSFKSSWEQLGLLPIQLEPYATEYIPQIIGMVEQLMERGYAYRSRDGVYYRVAKFARYGDLSNRRIHELESGARIEVDEFKEDPLDFALWKFAKPGEPSWESPWGAGRPGWHIECSAMARELLGEELDIHGGGADLIFPHHENEIAQSEPLMKNTDKPMSKIWMHGGLLLYQSKKMSKSLGNFEPVANLLERYDPQAIRFLFLQTGYSKVMNFTEESITAAGIGLAKLRDNYRRLKKIAESNVNLDDFRFAPDPMKQGKSPDSIMEEQLNDDLNTAGALRELLALSASAATYEQSGSADLAAKALDRLTYWAKVLGLEPNERWHADQRTSLPADFIERLQQELGAEISVGASAPAGAIESVIAARNKARADKNWSESDRLRDVLLRCGVALKDSKEGTTWTVTG